MDTKEYFGWLGKLKVGDVVDVYWTAGSGGHYHGMAKIVRVNRQSIAAALTEEVPVYGAGVGNEPYPVGHVITVPTNPGDRRFRAFFNAPMPPGLKRLEPYRSASLARELVKVAKELMAYEVHGGNLANVIREMRTGQWGYGALFKGKTHRVAGKAYAKSGEMRAWFDLEESLTKAMVKKVTFAGQIGEMLVVEIVGSADRTDTYVFTKVPYEELVRGVATPPAPLTSDLRSQIAQKLMDRGMHNLGERMSKSGDQYGIDGKARRIGLGRAKLMANYLLVVDETPAGSSRRVQDSRWNTEKMWLIKDANDALLDRLSKWVKDAPEMTEVRQKAYEEGLAGRHYAIWTGLLKTAGKKEADDGTDAANDYVRRMTRVLRWLDGHMYPFRKYEVAGSRVMLSDSWDASGAVMLAKEGLIGEWAHKMSDELGQAVTLIDSGVSEEGMWAMIEVNG
jgi:hypothetical protein